MMSIRNKWRAKTHGKGEVNLPVMLERIVGLKEANILGGDRLG